MIYISGSNLEITYDGRDELSEFLKTQIYKI